MTSITMLAANIRRRINESPQHSQRLRIYRVPHDLRQVNEDAYSPVLVSIGPLHHNEERLLPMEDYKLKCLQSFLSMTEPQVNDATNLLNLCLSTIKESEPQIRECYVVPIDLSSDDFVQMVLIDSVFIIEFLRKVFRSPQREYDYILDTSFFGRVCRDIKLEENQLPFFILDQLYCHAFQTNANVPSFTEIACGFLDIDRNNHPNIGGPNYFHLLHMLVVHSSPAGITIRNNATTCTKGLFFPPATILCAAGIRFKVNGKASSLLDITFDSVRRIIEMPALLLTNDTDLKLRNMVAFEQCNLYGSTETRYLTDYLHFLNCLISTCEDVKLLVGFGIIQNSMGSPEQVVDSINSLRTHTYTTPTGYYYEKISSDINYHSKVPWNKYRATLQLVYFRNPWTMLAVVNAMIILLLTVIQVLATLAPLKPSHA